MINSNHKIEKIKDAITRRKSISFDYQNDAGEISHRIGNPYVLYIFTTKKDGDKSIRLDIVQTGGESDTKTTKPFPSFRGFLFLSHIENIFILEDQPVFTPNHEDYNPTAPRYDNTIEKV